MQKEESKKSNFKPPALIERFATPMVEPPLPFQPVPPAQYTSPQHQEHRIIKLGTIHFLG